jgi:hypothetical protein
MKDEIMEENEIKRGRCEEDDKCTTEWENDVNVIDISQYLLQNLVLGISTDPSTPRLHSTSQRSLIIVNWFFMHES